MTTTLFEIEVNEFCDGFPVINSEVAGKLFSTFNGSDSYGLLRDLFASTLVIEELRATAMESKSVQYTVSEVPAKFAYSFVGKPVLTEDFLRKFSEFFNNGHTPKISKLLSELQDMNKGVVLRQFSDEQLEYIVELLLMIHDAVYSRNYYNLWVNRIPKHISDDMISEVFDQQFLSFVKLFEGSSTNAEVAEAKQKSFVNSQVLVREIVNFLVLARKRSYFSNTVSTAFYNLVSLHSSIASFVIDFQNALDFEGYEYDVIGVAMQERGVYQSLASAVGVGTFVGGNVFRYEVSKFDNIHGSPFMTADFLKYMYKFFGGGHSAELRKVLERAVVNTVKFEMSPISQRYPMLSKSPVSFRYVFRSVSEDGSKYHLDKDFLYHLESFFRGGNTAVSSQLFYDLENIVR